MACIRRRGCCCMDMAQAATVLTLLLLSVAMVCSGGRSSPAAAGGASGLCGPVEDERTAVYPFWSRCDNPALYDYAGGAYKLSSPTREGELFLAPEWDESNSTYYVRLAKEGATYAFSHLTREFRPYVKLFQGFFILNVATNRVLHWRNEGEGEDFLVETDIPSGISFFSFAPYEGQLVLPCPRILGAQCKGYSIRGFNSTSGLAAYVEDGVTYFKQSDTDLFPFTLRRQSTIASVV